MRSPALASLLGFLLVLSPACFGDDPELSPAGGTNPDSGTPVIAGQTCTDGSACAGGAPCVDGFCCDSACNGTCEACNVAGQEGRCAPVTGAPRHGTCEGDATGPCAGSCDGMNRTACTYPAVQCGAAGSCAGGVAIVPSTCKAGTCPAAPAPQTCALGCFEEGCLGVKQIAGGYYHVCAALTDERVRCWGGNSQGQAGQNPATTTVTSPAQVGALTGVQSVAATFDSSCALLSNKTVMCWGSNKSGELGRGAVDAVAHDAPALVVGLADATFLGGSSGSHYCAIVAGGGVKCWGGNGSGQLGDGTSGAAASKPSPVAVCAPGSTATPCAPMTGATFVAGGDKHTCAALAGGKVACWGSNARGELGQPADATPHPFPAYVTPDLTATYLTAGNQVTCAASGGTAKCWGSNGLGVLGHGTVGGQDPEPKAVCTKLDCSSQLTAVTGVATYDESACAVAGGAVKCWGTNSGGQLGDGNATTSQSYAASTAIASGAVYVTSAGTANYAIVVDGANRDVRCWGQEASSQCGTGGPSADRTTPVAPKW